MTTGESFLKEKSNGTTSLTASQRGWRAELSLRYERLRSGKCILRDRRHHGPLLVQRPFYPEGDEVCHTYLIHPPAGIVGGDGLQLELELEPKAHALVTTPGASRWYFSRGHTACVRQKVQLKEDAIIEWLPQETLFFDGTHADLRTRIDLASEARFCGWEIIGLGRPACGEFFSHGSIDVRLELFREGQPLLLERLHSRDGVVPGMLGYTAYATFCATGAQSQTLAKARRVLALHGGGPKGATLIRDLLIVRALAPQCEALVLMFRELWNVLRFELFGRSAEVPRIWYT